MRIAMNMQKVHFTLEHFSPFQTQHRGGMATRAHAASYACRHARTTQTQKPKPIFPLGSTALMIPLISDECVYPPAPLGATRLRSICILHPYASLYPLSCIPFILVSCILYEAIVHSPA